MKIRQVVVLGDPAQEKSSILPDLEELGLQICDRLSSPGEDCLLICDSFFECTASGSSTIRQALAGGCSVLLNPDSHQSVLEEIKQTGKLCDGTKRELSAYALYRCLESDARRLAEMQGKSCPAMW